MRRATIICVFLLALHAVGNGQSLTVYRSSWSVSETVSRLEQTIATLTSGKESTIIGSKPSVLSDTLSVVHLEAAHLTNALLACEPTTVIDLPFKIVVWRENDDVYLGFMDPYFMKKRFLIRDCDESLEEAARLYLRVVNETLKSH